MTSNGKGHGWPAVLRGYGVADETASRLVESLAAAESAAVEFCRLLDRWARGEPEPTTAGRREAALRDAAERAESALADLQEPLGRFLVELGSNGGAEDRSWYGEPGAGEVLVWDDVLRRAGVSACPGRVARVYLELAVLVRALQGLAASGAVGSPPRPGALHAGLFDLRENLYESAVDELKALAA